MPVTTPPYLATENATNVAGSEPDWGKLVEFCNRVQNSVGSSAMKGALLAIMKRVKHRDEHIQLQALAVSGWGSGGAAVVLCPPHLSACEFCTVVGVVCEQLWQLFSSRDE